MNGRMTLLIALSAIFALTVSASADVLFRDDFSGGIDPAWSILNQDTGYYSVSANTLDVTCTSSILYPGYETPANVFLLDTPTAAGGNFALTMRVARFEPEDTLQHIYLVAFDDADHHAWYGYNFWPGWGRSTTMNFTEEGASDGKVGPQRDAGAGSFYLRFSKMGSLYTGAISTDGVTYLDVLNKSWGFASPAPSARVGLVAGFDTTESHVANVDWFELSTVPEPASILVLLTGLGSVLGLARRGKA